MARRKLKLKKPEAALETGANQGFGRFAAILRALGKAGGGGVRMTDVAATTGLNKSTVHRLLKGLVEVQLVELDEEKGLFYLGFDLFVLGSVAANRFGILELAADHLTRLAQRTGDTVFLSVQSGSEAICIAREEGEYPIKVLTLNVGDRRPLGVGAGSLALLSALKNEEIEAAIEANAAALETFTNFNPAAIYDMVEQSRKQGYASNDGLIIRGMSAVGVPVFGGHNTPVASLSIAAVKDRMQPPRLQKVVEWLFAEAKSLQEQIAALTGGMSQKTLKRLLKK